MANAITTPPRLCG